MRRSPVFSLACLAALLALPAAAELEPAVIAPLTPHTAEYKVRISVVSGRLTTQLRSTEGGFVAQHVIRPTGMSKMLTRGRMDVTSFFTADAAGVKPVHYRAVDTIRDDPEVDLAFDWSRNVASGRVGEEDVTLELDDVSHDSVSLQYALMYDLLNGGPSAQYILFDVDKLRLANVSSAGNKRVETPAGDYDVIGIQHQKKGSSRTTTMWCAPELGFLPVIIEQHRKGKLNFRATLTRYVPSEI